MGNNTAARLIAIAKGELGYLEKKSNSQLESKTANAGAKNYTKYGAWYGLNPAAWCAMFVSWCFGQLTGSKLGAQNMLCGFLWTSCTAMYNAFKKEGRVFSTPKAGDIIVFNKAPGSSTMAHTGIVTEVKGGRVYTVEGNTSAASGVIANGGGVAAKSYALTNNRIGGYLRPEYDAELAAEKKPETKTEVKTMSVELLILKKGMKGEAVKALQVLLNLRGCNCGTVDGDFGTKTDAALRVFQLNRGLTVDGECGAKSWAALIGG